MSAKLDQKKDETVQVETILERLEELDAVCKTCRGSGKVVCWSCNTDFCGVCDGDKEIDCACMGGANPHDFVVKSQAHDDDDN